MAKIEDEDDLYSIFSKSCASLYKKENDMIGKYDIDVGIIIFPPIDNPFSFFHPTIDVVVDRYDTFNHPSWLCLYTLVCHICKYYFDFIFKKKFLFSVYCI
ncbi:hypothetical protein R3W88_027157 [Solanum pinnatisectum]|uniref:MADS-box domain-containing protein n=1 Tax=Solanum pinnatisectum TaxID=50273 RepID=A0AAV9LGH3_9SOLN|nr:hypothetical protein R3W88_027157 [Solanum pinnatisectum]